MLSASNARKRRRNGSSVAGSEDNKKGKTNGERDSISEQSERYHDHLVHVRGVPGEKSTDTNASLEVSGDQGNSASMATELVFPCQVPESWRESFQTYRPQTDASPSSSSHGRVLSDLRSQGFSALSTTIQEKKNVLVVAFSKHMPENKLVFLKFSTKSCSTDKKSTLGDVDSAADSSIDEINMHQNINHPHIVELYDCFCMQKTRVLSMEYCQRGTLQDLLSTRDAGFLPEPVARPYFSNMLSALQYLHTLCIAHCDLNPSHFLIDHHDRIKLCDFRTARRCLNGELVTPRELNPGSTHYQPTEVVDGKEHDPRMADVWSLGAVLYKIVTSRTPQRDSIETDALNVPHLSTALGQLLTSMCQSSPNCRPLAGTILDDQWLGQSKSPKVAIGMCHVTRYPRKVQDPPRNN